MHRQSSSIPPLHTYFKGSKRIAAAVVAPKSDVECNPFLADGSSSSSSSSLIKNEVKTTNPGEPTFIQPSSTHNLKASRSIALGEHHLTLLSLHSAVEHALVVHLATSGGDAVDCSQPATSQIQLPSVVTYTTLRPIVERSCGRRFGPTELARLMWLWGAGAEEDRPGCNIGFHVTKSKTMDRAGNRSYDYFFSLQVGVDLPLDEEDEVEMESKAERRKRRISADGKVIPTTPPRKRVRPLDLPDEPQTPSPSPRSISAFARPTLLTPPASPSMHRTPIRSPSTSARSRSVSANGSLLSSPSLERSSLSLVSVWNTGMDRRKKEVRRRLVNWTLSCYETWRRERRLASVEETSQDHSRPSTPPPSSRQAVQGQGGILTPSATREEGWVPGRKRTKDFFAHAVEERILIREWDPAFPLDKVEHIPQAALPEVASLNRAAVSSAAPLRPMATLRGKAPKAIKGQPLGGAAGPLAHLSLTDRIKAKQDAKQSEMDARSGRGLGLMDCITEDSIGIEHSRSSMMANLKRRSALSRLQDIAESLYMIFTASSKTPSTTTQEGSVKKYPHLPINDVAKSICNSSKVAMSEVEARQSMKMLQELAPGFVEITRVGPREWVRLGTGITGQEVPTTNNGLLGLVRQRIRAEMDRS